MDKFIAVFQKIPLAHKALAVVMILAGMGAAYYFLGYQEQEKTIKKLVQQYNKLEDDLHAKQQVAANLTKYKKKVEFLQQKLEEKKKNLPDDSNLDHLLKTLNELSEKSQMRIIAFTPKQERRKNFYAEIPVAVELEGNYHEIATFFDKVAKEDRIINISNINLEEPKLRNGKMVLRAICEAKTFKTIAVGQKKSGKRKKKKRKKKAH
ncbi:MAG: type 4a pilus biogenesis protein PilO [Deltaproteobacteria bacterium]|nr:type 4a pilus biogenesis protein PilO [Deltaproteobacteria bacterium]